MRLQPAYAAPLFAALVIVSVACEKKPSAGGGAPAAAESAAASVASGAAPGASAPAPDPAADVAAPPAESAAADPASSSSPVSDKAARGLNPIPKATNGILPPGAADKVLRAGRRPIVRLLSEGSEPRSVLAYTFTKGDAQAVGMSLDMKMGIRGAGQQVPAATVPRLTMLLSVAPTEKNPAGDWNVDLNVTKISMEPKGIQQEQIAASLRPQLDAIQGLHVAYWVSPSGQVRDVNVETPQGFPAAAQQMLGSMSQSFESMVISLPSDPVGIGAKWEVISRVASAGLDLLQVATYTMTSRSGPKAKLDTSITQLAANDALKAPGMPDVGGRLRSLKSGATGTTDIDFKTPAPEGGTLHMLSSMDIELKQGSQEPQQSTVDSDMTVRFSRPKGGAATP